MTHLPTDAKARKDTPMARGLLDYFPLALAEIANVSRVGNEQHNPGEPMHWAKEKSTDEADCIIRHLIDRGTIDTDGLRHSAKVAWRALALLERELEAPAAETIFPCGCERDGFASTCHGADDCGLAPFNYFCVGHKRFHRERDERAKAGSTRSSAERTPAR